MNARQKRMVQARRKRTYMRKQLYIYEKLGNVCALCPSTDRLQLDRLTPPSLEVKRKKGTHHFIWATIDEELTHWRLLCGDCKNKKIQASRGRMVMKGMEAHGKISFYKYCGPPKCRACLDAHRLQVRLSKRRLDARKKGLNPDRLLEEDQVRSY